MGGERFDTPQPEAYLFGENGDLNFLGSRPTAVSYLDLTHLPLCIVSTILWNQFLINRRKTNGIFFRYDFSFHIHHHKLMSQRKRSKV